MTLLAGALAMLFSFGFVSCSDSDDDNNGSTNTSETSAPTTDKGDSEKQSSSGEQTATINAAWDFTTQPEGFPTTDTESDAITDFTISPNSGSGATLKATGRFKWATGGYIQSQATTGSTIANASGWTKSSSGKWFTFTLSKAAKVTIVFSGTGATDAKRWIAIYKEDGTEIFSQGSLGADKVTKEFASVPAGTYTIPTNASRVYSLKCE